MSRMLQALKDLQGRATPPSCILTGVDDVRAISEPEAPPISSESAIEPGEESPSPEEDAADVADVPAEAAASLMAPERAPEATASSVSRTASQASDVAIGPTSLQHAVTEPAPLSDAEMQPIPAEAAGEEPSISPDAQADEQQHNDPPLTERVEQLLDGIFVALVDEPAGHSVLEVQTVAPFVDESGLAMAPCDVHMPQPLTPARPEARRLDNSTAPFTACIARHLDKAETTRAFASLADAIAADLEHCSAPLVLLLGAETDPDMAETAGTLAVAIQRHYGRILLVDIAGLQGHLTQRFQLTGRPGLADVLLQRRDWESELVAVGAEIHLLPAGSEIASPVVVPARLAELLDCCRAFYDVIVVTGAQASPLTAAIARRCDASYLLVRLGTTEQRAADDVASWLLTHGARLMGCIVTNAKV